MVIWGQERLETHIILTAYSRPIPEKNVASCHVFASLGVCGGDALGAFGGGRNAPRPTGPLLPIKCTIKQSPQSGFSNATRLNTSSEEDKLDGRHSSMSSVQCWTKVSLGLGLTVRMSGYPSDESQS